MLVSKHSHSLKSRHQSAALEIDRASEALWNQLAVVGVGVIKAAAGEHLVGPKEHHLAAITEQAQGLFRLTS